MQTFYCNKHNCNIKTIHTAKSLYKKFYFQSNLQLQNKVAEQESDAIF